MLSDIIRDKIVNSLFSESAKLRFPERKRENLHRISIDKKKIVNYFFYKNYIYKPTCA